MSLWAQYITELRGPVRHWLEYPDCFVSYSFPDWLPDCLIIHDMFVLPELRKSGRGKALLDDVFEAGRKAGKRYVVAELELGTLTFDMAFRAQTAVGFVPVGAKNDILCMKKEIPNG